MDIDLLRRGVADQASLVQLVANCAAMEDVSDGVIFDATTIVVEAIRDNTDYGGMPVRLNAYPVETSVAEKFHAMVDLDMQNSRMKDFYAICVR